MGRFTAPIGAAALGNNPATVVRPAGRVVADMDAKGLRLHDGVRPGGFLFANDLVSVKKYGAKCDGITDDTAAVQEAMDDPNVDALFVPDECVIDKVMGSNVRFFGFGSRFIKKPGTKGRMFDIDGDNKFEGVTLDYNWANADQTSNVTGKYFNNIAIYQEHGSLTLRDVSFTGTCGTAVFNNGGSVDIQGCDFSGWALHNGGTGDGLLIPYVIICYAAPDTLNETITITGNRFFGTIDPAQVHRNATGVFINSSDTGNRRFRTAIVSKNVMVACSTNAGGNVTGAIDTYNGAQGVEIEGNIIRFSTYSGVKAQNITRAVIAKNIIFDMARPAGSGLAQAGGIMTVEKARGSTVEEHSVLIDGNIIGNDPTGAVAGGAEYYAIFNNCDYAKIVNNQINGVFKVSGSGAGIENGGDHVKISGNHGGNVQGVFIFTYGNFVEISGGNDFTSDGENAGDVAVLFTGDGVKIRGNKFRAVIASAGPAIRTNGLVNRFVIEGNDIQGYATGVDIRTITGAASGHIGVNTFSAVTLEYNVVATAEVTRTFRSLQPVEEIYNAPTLSPGEPSALKVTSVFGARQGKHQVTIVPLTDTKGFIATGWVSANDQVTWYIFNPNGNPTAGAQDPTTNPYRIICTEVA